MIKQKNYWLLDMKYLTVNTVDHSHDIQKNSYTPDIVLILAGANS